MEVLVVDFGILKNHDIIIFISNSGNTEEIVYILKYLKHTFHKKVTCISIVANEKCQMEKYSDFCFHVKPIQEADFIEMTPSVSSSIFMMILDMIGIHVSSGITKEQFKKNHPSGALGQK
jgi:arabinose-5-phosphate isomerase